MSVAFFSATDRYNAFISVMLSQVFAATAVDDIAIIKDTTMIFRFMTRLRLLLE
jgi:2-phospho-L-lactate guanylyltransferase (CobY/MobA/RfbA family)